MTTRINLCTTSAQWLKLDGEHLPPSPPPPPFLPLAIINVSPYSIGSSGRHVEHQDSVDSQVPQGGGGGGGNSNFLTPYNHPHTFPVSGTGSSPNLGRKMSSASNFSGCEDVSGGEAPDGQNHDFKPPKVNHTHTPSVTCVTSHTRTRTLSLSNHQPDTHFMKKIPPGSEASNILVGEVDFLDHPIIAFVRLKEGVLLGDITEVPQPFQPSNYFN